jgi:uncharacterized protein YggT (Ycf19 family)
MTLIHFILNLAALLLWVKWRLQPTAIPASSPSLAVGSLLPRTPRHETRWILPGALIALLLGRAFFYWQLSPASDWIARLDLGIVTLAFRSDFGWEMFLYSFASFGLWLTVFHLSLLLLLITNRNIALHVPGMRWMRSQLGWLAHRAIPLQLLLPWFAATLLWMPAGLLLPHWGLLPAASPLQILGQGALIALAMFLSWKYVIVGLLVLHLLHNYLHLGSHPFWNFVEESGRQFLRPLRWCPLQLGPIDLAPAVGAAAAWFGAKYTALLLTWIYARLAP